MWALFKISRSVEKHIVIGGFSVYPVLELLSVRFSLAMIIQTSSNKGLHSSRNSEFLSPWVLLQSSSQNSKGKHCSPHRDLSRQASFLSWMPATAFLITEKVQHPTVDALQHTISETKSDCWDNINQDINTSINKNYYYLFPKMCSKLHM